MEAVLETVFLKILNMSIGGAFVILAVLLARLLLRRAPRAISFALWAIVAVRLLIPFSIEIEHSPVPVPAEPVPVNIGTMLTPQIDTGIAPLDELVNESLPAATPQYSLNPMQILTAAAAVIWLAGAAAVLIADGISLLLLRRRLVGAVRMEEGVWMADRIPAPFVWGVFRPRIYIPSGTPETAIPYILAHERAHMRRLDPFWKALGCLTLALHWFNPLCWIGFVLFVSDMEAACDEAVLRRSAEDIRAEYSEALLACCAGGRFAALFPPAFGETDPKSRIQSVLKYKKASRAAVILAVAAVAAVCIGCAFSQKDGEEQSDNPPDGITDSAETTADTTPDSSVSPFGGADAPKETAYAVTFPAYSDTRAPMYATICKDTAPFTVTLTLPAGWTIGAPESFDAPFYSPLSQLLSPVCFYKDGQRVGSMGFYPIQYDLSEGNETYLACFPVMFGNMTRWDSDSWRSVSENGSVKVGTCDIHRRLDAWDSAAAAGMMGAQMPTFVTRGIAAYDTEQMVMIGIELEAHHEQGDDGYWTTESYASDEEWRQIAESVTIIAGGERADWEVPTTQTAQITFPAYQGGRTEYNAYIYDTEPFTLTMELPLGWKMSIPAASEQTATLPFTAVTLRYGTETVGSVGFMPFEVYEGMTPEDAGFYRMVYNQLMLGNLVTWDTDYTPVESTRTDTFCAATCRVSEPIVVEGVPAAGWERRTRPAIVAYDTEMLVYIAMDFAEGAVTDEQWKAIAESIRLAPVSTDG